MQMLRLSILYLSKQVTLGLPIFNLKILKKILATTRNYKKYSTFIKMLQSALKNQIETVYIDILTYSDVEQIKNKDLINYKLKICVQISKNQLNWNNLQQLIYENIQRINQLESELQKTLNNSKSKYNTNLSRSPSVSRPSNKQKVHSLLVIILPKEKVLINQAQSGKNSWDSDFESSFRRKSNQKRTEQSPPARQSSSKITSLEFKQLNSQKFQNKKIIKTSDTNKFEDPEEQCLIKRFKRKKQRKYNNNNYN